MFVCLHFLLYENLDQNCISLFVFFLFLPKLCRIMYRNRKKQSFLYEQDKIMGKLKSSTQ